MCRRTPPRPATPATPRHAPPRPTFVSSRRTAPRLASPRLASPRSRNANVIYFDRSACRRKEDTVTVAMNGGIAAPTAPQRRKDAVASGEWRSQTRGKTWAAISAPRRGWRVQGGWRSHAEPGAASRRFIWGGGLAFPVPADSCQRRRRYSIFSRDIQRSSCPRLCFAFSLDI